MTSTTPPRKQLSEMTSEELISERTYWEQCLKNAKGWGSHLSAAEVTRELLRREK